MREGRSINSAKNIIWGYANIVIGLLLSFINRTVFIKVLGIEYLGINGLFSNILQMLSLADLGFSTAMAYSYYEPIAENNIDKIFSLNRFYKIIYRYVAAGIAVIGLALTPFLEQITNLEQPIKHLHLYYLLTLAGTISSYLMVYKSTLINAYQKNYIVSKYNSIVRLIVTAIQVVFLILTRNFIVYLIIVVCGNLFNNFRISIAADELFPFIKQKKKDALIKKDKQEIFKNIKSMFIYKISSVLINSTDNILISSIVGTVFVGYYSNYLIIVNNLSSFIGATFTSLTASIGNVIVNEDDKKRYGLFRTVQIASFWFSTVVVACIYVLIDKFIGIWLGNGFLLDKWTVMAILFNLYLTCILQPIWIYREATGMYRKTKYIMLITAVLNLILSIWWGVCFGIAGILFASAAAKLLTYFWYEPILLFKDFFDAKPTRFFINIIINIISVVMIVLLLKQIVDLTTLNGWIGFLLMPLYVSLLQIFYLRYAGCKIEILKICLVE